MTAKPWAVQEIIASLEKQAAVHREHEARHAEREAFHREQRLSHATELEAITRRLDDFRAAAAAAMDLAGRDPAAPAAAAVEDIGPASRPHLTRLVRRVLQDLAPGHHVGPKWITYEVNRQFGSRLRKLVSIRQVSAVLRRMHKQGKLKLQRSGKPHHEARYALVG